MVISGKGSGCDGVTGDRVFGGVDLPRWEETRSWEGAVEDGLVLPIRLYLI